MSSSIKNNPATDQQKATVTVPLVDILHEAESGLLALSIHTGLRVLQELMDAEVDQLAGIKGRHNPDRQAVRHGTEQGFVYRGDRKIPLTHPRVRTQDSAEELPLATYHAFQDPTQATQTVLERMLFGLASRQQVHADAAFESAVETAGPSKSTVSRRFIQATQQALDQFLRRRIDDQTWVVLMIDGIRVGGHLVVVALGIDATGHKRILGMSEGATENTTVVKHLLTDLVDRGLAFPGGGLAVIDGAKALAKGLHEVFGSALRIQRCQIHKQRNVLDEVAESAKHNVQLALRKAYQEPEAPKALAALEKLAQELAHDYPSAAASLREGLAETLTVHQLGLSGTLRQSLANTNVLESVNSQYRALAKNVKHWSNGVQVLRWLAAASFFIEDRLTRIPGYRDLPQLQQALHPTVPPEQARVHAGESSASG